MIDAREKGGMTMHETLTFAVIGGDKRSLFAARRLEEYGFRTALFAISGGQPYEEYKKIKADALLLPLPLTKDGKTLFAPDEKEPISVSDVLSAAPADALLFAGRTGGISDERLTDYSAREDFAIMNAVPTAEGALLLALQGLDETICGMRVAVVGFGRVGAQTARLFRAAGAEVTVFARKTEARMSARALGCKAEATDDLEIAASDFRLFINTVPARLFTSKVLSALRKDAYVIDLASAPYGLDFSEAGRLGRKAICAAGLPGKYFPETAGRAVAETIVHILREKHYF